ncbi:MAG: hypothetical protein TE42_05395 [Candidatus Synechococcus spongiarum SP3]|uniref:Uncharacterized protein n=1 Tax=Candidatus Synechococcus spongiarum SP3 TaxID=1604020 RepID=A0A0G2HL14_9SYNE|nr:MAG: hypothetical protein TE42_05395 [Candidatus Synechococcus spongiarum SP3]
MLHPQLPADLETVWPWWRAFFHGVTATAEAGAGPPDGYGCLLFPRRFRCLRSDLKDGLAKLEARQREDNKALNEKLDRLLESRLPATRQPPATGSHDPRQQQQRPSPSGRNPDAAGFWFPPAGIGRRCCPPGQGADNHRQPPETDFAALGGSTRG